MAGELVFIGKFFDIFNVKPSLLFIIIIYAPQPYNLEIYKFTLLLPSMQTKSTFSTEQPSSTPSSGTTTVNGTEIPNNNNPIHASDVPYPSDPYEDVRQFNRFTDIYLGGLWNRLESELGKLENESSNFDYDVQLTSGCMRVKLPDDAEVVICKSPQDQELKLESNLHSISTGEGVDPREEASFKFVEEEGEFMTSDVGNRVPLHEFLEQHLATVLNKELDLEPQPHGMNDKVYGPDPT
jgi:frataxin-like iron-binding protein CyaY